MKTCSRCKTTKELTAFNKKQDAKDGMHSYCKLCQSAYNHQYHKENKKTIARRKHQYHYANLKTRIKNGAKWTADRRARKLKATFGNEELNDLVFKEAYALSKLRKEATGVPFEVDHIVPLKGKNVCGFHSWNNIQVIPKSQNRSKGNRMENL